MATKQWYQKLGFKSYPLDPRSNTNLIGVDNIEKRLVSYIQQGNMCLLCGLTGSGKTSMLQKIMKNNSLKKFDFFYISADGIKKDKEIDSLVKSKMNIFDRILFKKPKNMVILLDECQVASRILTESIKSKWNETYGSGEKVVHSVVVSQIPSKLTSNFSGSFMDRLGKRAIRMKKLKPSELKKVLEIRLQNDKYDLINKFDKKALDFLVKSCDGSVRQLLEFSDTVFREIDNIDEKALLDNNFKIKKEHVFTFLQEFGVKGNYSRSTIKNNMKQIKSSKRLSKAVEMFESFGEMNSSQLAEKMDTSKSCANNYIKRLDSLNALMISHTENKTKFYVLSPAIKHEVVSE
ncbi:MAG: AAA family ATPase [Nanobdellota archaeon]